MKRALWLVFFTMILVASAFVASRILLRRSIQNVDFAGLGDQLEQPIMRKITVDLEGKFYGRVEPGFTRTFVRANEIGLSAIHRPRPLPVSSQEMLTIKPDDRLQAWGNPFCIFELTSSIIVASAGPATHFTRN